MPKKKSGTTGIILNWDDTFLARKDLTPVEQAIATFTTEAKETVKTPVQNTRDVCPEKLAIAIG